MNDLEESDNEEDNILKTSGYERNKDIKID
jgi:hypothetical protein